MNVGKMRYLMTLQNPDTTADGQGGVSDVDDGWNDQEKLWAQIEPTAGNKKWEAAQIVRSVSHIITTHYTTPYNISQRLTHDGRVFLVRGVIDVGEARKELQWQCEELTG
jgi:SPP1 family predicted phage head-tail adaptor